jgi:hypothetical protein
MHLVNVILFVHVFIVLCAISIAAILHTAQFVSRGATTTATLKAWSPTAHRIEPLFPVLALVLFGLGAWLVQLSHGEFRWSDGWVITATVGLALMEAVGGAVLAPHGKKQHEAIMAAADGPIDPALRAMVVDPLPWAAAFFETATALGIVWIMINKPNGAASAIIVAAFAIVGALIGVAAARGKAPAIIATAAPLAAQADA